MISIRQLKMMASVGVFGIAASVLVACAAEEAISKADFDAVSQQVAATRQQLAAKEKEAADLQSKLDQAAKQTTLLAAKPDAPPRATPTPAPAGFVPPPPPAIPASFQQPVALYIYADTVTAGPGESRFNYDAAGIPNPSCVASSVFRRGMHLVWRYEAVETASGKRLTDAEVERAAVRLPNGEELTGRFSRHGAGADAPWFWTSAWDVPLDYPMGVLDWEIVVTTKDGKRGSFKPWSVSIPERAIESRTQIIG